MFNRACGAGSIGRGAAWFNSFYAKTAIRVQKSRPPRARKRARRSEHLLGVASNGHCSFPEPVTISSEKYKTSNIEHS